jgi:glycosyltransferase involved in cell wall biosynthesis
MLGLVPGVVGGMETYARNLARVLPTLDERYRYVAAIGTELRGIASGTPGRLTEWVADSAHTTWTRRVRPLRTLLQSGALHRQLRALRPDVLHCLMMFPKPPWGAPNMVVTLPDLNFELFPECWHPVDRRIMRASCRLATRQAQAIVTLSEFSKRTLVERYRVPPERIFVTPLGVRSDHFSPGGCPSSGDPWREFDLPAQVLFFPANTWPHKNHLRLLEALAVLRDTYGLRPGLILTGAPKSAHAAVLSGVAQLGLERQVRWLGHVPEDRLVALYRGATALVCPSLHEGFGMPILEAMACGCPVACSPTTGTGETAGEAALTFDPDDVSDIAATVGALLANTDLRRDLARRGLRRAAEFTWERAGRSTLDVYEDVATRARAEGTRR